MTTVVGLVPMRHDSERVKGKNYRLLGGRPLYHHVVAALLDSGVVDQVLIDTDSPFIAEDAPSHFDRVTVIPRPEHLLGGHTPMNAILLHDVAQVDADLYLQTHSTNPLLRASTIAAAVKTLVDQRPEHDSLFGVTPLQTRLWWDGARAVNHDPAVLLRTQDLPPIYEENSNLYLFDRETLERRGNRIGDRPLLFPIDRAEAWDIDEEIDWTVVEALYAQREHAGE
ncbi:MAG TPA: acylneuraminate cytidylyltransferase family protein [Acidimicrobiales bacterium]|nr:acylneuraminate cytidylyltransferase family protein [Acidimicrobiales bacterium]